MTGTHHPNSHSRTAVSFPTAILLALCLAAVCLPTLTAQTSQPFDLLITGGRIVDGAGNPWVRGSVAIRGDRIVAMGHLPGAKAKRWPGPDADRPGKNPQHVTMPHLHS